MKENVEHSDGGSNCSKMTRHELEIPVQSVSSASSPYRPHAPMQQFITPDVIQPFPLASFSFTKKTRRKKKSSEVLTSTPVYKRLEEDENVRREKRSTVKRAT